MRHFLTVAVAAVLAVFAPSALALDQQPAEHIQAKLRRGEQSVRSVNLGGWLVSEYWMTKNSPLWTGVPPKTAEQGEYAVMGFLGNTTGTAAFELHRDTWIREDDIRDIAAAGLNAVRVPVGYWVVRDAVETLPACFSSQIDRYARGSLKYLDTLVNLWAVKYNVAVMLSLHAHQGSQNGYEHSAPPGEKVLSWSALPANVESSLYVVEFLAGRYQNSAAFLGLNVMNEPARPTDSDVLDRFYRNAYDRVRSKSSDCIVAVSPFLTEQDAAHLNGLLDTPRYSNVWHELHSYFVWGYEGLSASQVIDAVGNYWNNTLGPATASTARPPLFIGEWSMGGPNGTDKLIDDTYNFRTFGQRQLDMFNRLARGGWAFWSWKHSDESVPKRSGWGMRALLRNGDLKLK